MPATIRLLNQPEVHCVAPHVLAGLSSERYKIGAQADDEAVTLLLHGEIGDPWEQLDSGSVSRFLLANAGKPVNVRVNSFGGLAYDGIAIANALAEHDGHVTAIVDAMAGSAASVAINGADEIKMHATAQLFVHNAWGIAIGGVGVMLDVAAWLDKVNASLAESYRARTGQTLTQIQDWMRGEHDGTVFSAAEAVANGFADSLIATKAGKAAAKDQRPANVRSAVANWQAAERRLRLLELDDHSYVTQDFSALGVSRK